VTTAAETVGPTAVGVAERLERAGAVTVWRLEVAKLCRQLPVLGIAAVCVVAPFVFVLGLEVQSTVPQDTLFGRWVHESGFAIPLVVLGFTGQWALPVLTSIVAGDMFAAEDHFGTWKTLLTRGVSRGQVFAGKVVATMSYAVVITAVLAVASVVAGFAMGRQPLVGLTGQLVGSGRSLELVVASWASVLPAVVAFTAIGLFFSVATRSRPAALGAPVAIAWALQLVALVNVPASVSAAFPTSAFSAWHGFWAAPSFGKPFVLGLVASGAWTLAALLAAGVIFFKRSIPAR
jgi:ABC-2 type transport system permease protein